MRWWGCKPLDNGKLEHFDYDEDGDIFSVTFSTATSPTQIYTIKGKKRRKLRMHTNEKILGVPDAVLAAGEDASFVSHDGLRVSARLYLPAKSLGYKGREAASLLHSRRAARAGATGFCMVLHAVDPVPHAARLRGVRAERARLHRLWTVVYHARGSTIGADRTGSTTSMR